MLRSDSGDGLKIVLNMFTTGISNYQRSKERTEDKLENTISIWLRILNYVSPSEEVRRDLEGRQAKEKPLSRNDLI